MHEVMSSPAYRNRIRTIPSVVGLVLPTSLPLQSGSIDEWP